MRKNDPPMEPVFYTVKELAKRWLCDRKTVFRRTKQMGIKPFKFNQRSVLYPIDQVLSAELRHRTDR